MKYKPPRTILILGGTAEAALLAKKLARQPENRVISSLAGLTRKPPALPGEIRVGGFGGVAGLVSYLHREKVDEIIDATHPFAVQMSAHATKASKLAGVKFSRINRPPWKRQKGDNWLPVADLQSAAAALPAGARAFLALGSKHLEAFFSRDDVRFTVRMVDMPTTPLPFKHLSLILGRANKTIPPERKLFRDQSITHLVCRNSGGSRGMAKLAAARELGIQVIMIERPEL